ncbi:TM1266 family iron-only hydrogenase system putative regulator [uncultured Parvimonas sp.]|uniref:TM1266 family iron-only hydrogenase system putative regulator n=1 Tax=uncultured Parvimonas sp. TaxID=747372 RepID=UPI0025934A20|nr:TM1266 family iron-only hydrogenase system putative regulator [uncultured Parvimonas sp.]
MRIAIVAIFIHNKESATSVNDLLHEYTDMIVGRMGLPKVEESINIITLVVKGEQERISAMSGKLGRLKEVVCSVTYAKNR